MKKKSSTTYMHSDKLYQDLPRPTPSFFTFRRLIFMKTGRRCAPFLQNCFLNIKIVSLLSFKFRDSNIFTYQSSKLYPRLKLISSIYCEQPTRRRHASTGNHQSRTSIKLLSINIKRLHIVQAFTFNQPVCHNISNW